MHLPFSDTQWPICFMCWGVVKYSFIHSVFVLDESVLWLYFIIYNSICWTL